MRFWGYPLRAFDAVLDRAVAVAGALSLSQVPAFISHYVQRLGGHVAEAERNVAGWKAIAADTGHADVAALSQAFLSSAVAETVEAGRKCLGDVERLHSLQRAMESIGNAAPWKRGLTFLRHAESSIAGETLESFAPNVPVDPESIVYAVVGLVLGAVVYRGIKSGCRAGVRAAGARAGKRQTGSPQ